MRLPPEKLHKILCGFPSCSSFSTLLSVSRQCYRRVAACLWLELSVLLSQLARCHQCPRFRMVKTCLMHKTTDLDPPAHQLNPFFILFAISKRCVGISSWLTVCVLFSGGSKSTQESRTRGHHLRSDRSELKTSRATCRSRSGIKKK